MKWCVSFPEEQVLLVRPSLTAICYGNKPAAKLLSVLLYRHSIRKESKSDAENINELKAARGGKADQDTTYRIFRKQSQLVADMCDEITEKTLHDVAVPLLQLLGYLDIEENLACNCYMLNIDAVQAALKAYTETPNQLEKFLIDHCQLEKFLIDKKDFLSARKGEDGLEEVLIDKKKFLSQLEKVLIQNRNTSNCHRGRKPASSAGPDDNPKPPKSNKRYKNKDKERMIDAHSISPSFSENTEEKETPQPTTIRTPEEETLLSWLRADNPREGKPETLKGRLQKMLPHVNTQEKAHDLFLHTQKLIMQSNRTDKTVSIGNMVEDWIFNAWIQAQQPEPEADQQQGMTHEEADNFAQWLMQQPGLCYEVVALDQSQSGAWCTCLIYGDGSQDVLYFESPDHYLNPSKWEAARIEDARIYAASLTPQTALA